MLIKEEAFANALSCTHNSLLGGDKLFSHNHLVTLVKESSGNVSLSPTHPLRLPVNSLHSNYFLAIDAFKSFFMFFLE